MKTKYIDSEVIDKILETMPFSDRLIFRIAIETGMRVGDIVSLKGKNIIGNKICFTAQKTGKSAQIPISPRLLRDISVKTKKNSWLFPSPKNSLKHITRQCVWQRVKRACAASGVDPSGVAPHSFRKFFAVELFKREGLEATRCALQHDKASTTQIYALSDFTSGSNGDLPLLRRDLPYIISEVVSALNLRKL